jgi:hypothetical protein
MATSFDGAVANGFGRLWIHVHEAQALWQCGYPVLPGFRLPSGWKLSTGGLPVPPIPTGSTRQAAIYDHYWGTLTAEEHNDPQWDPDNRHAWSAFFARQREDCLAAYDGPGPPPENFNSEGWR